MPTDCVKQLFSTKGDRALWWASANVQVGLILEGIVHPKMKLLSSFTHPHIVPNLYKLTCVKHNRIWRTKLKNQTVVDPYWLPWVNNTTGTIICLITSTLQNIFFCVQHKKKTLTSVWNNMRVSKLWWNFHFGVNYPFKINHFCLKKNTHRDLLSQNGWKPLITVLKLYSRIRQVSNNTQHIGYILSVSFNIQNLLHLNHFLSPSKCFNCLHAEAKREQCWGGNSFVSRLKTLCFKSLLEMNMGNFLFVPYLILKKTCWLNELNERFSSFK